MSKRSRIRRVDFHLLLPCPEVNLFASIWDVTLTSHEITYKILLGFNKSSLLFLYMRIFLSKKFVWSCCVTLGIVITWTTASVVSTIFQCNPIAGFWDSKIPGMKCFDTDVFWYGYAIIDIITDIVILWLPMWEVRKLHLPVLQRIGVGAIFALGAL